MILKKRKKYEAGLILCPPWGIDYPPLNLGYLSSYLRSEGIKTRLFDLNIDFYHEVDDDLKHIWDPSSSTIWSSQKEFNIILPKIRKNIKDNIKEILKNDYHCLCFSINTANRLISIEIAREIKKESNIPIIFGGPYCKKPEATENIPKEIVDHIIISNRGSEIPYVLRSIKKNEDLPWKIEGKDKKEIITSVFPDYSDLDLYKYRDKRLPFILSIGCPRRCHFCNHVHFSPEFITRDPKLVFDEINYYYKDCGIKRFVSNDLLINGDIKKLEEFCDLIIESGIDIEWDGQGIIRDMPERIFKKLKKSGLNSILFGVESGSEKVLRKNNKLHTPEMAIECIKKANKAGIKVFINIMIGLPGETEEDFQKTLSFISENKKMIQGVASLNLTILDKLSYWYKNREEFGYYIDPKHDNALRWIDLNQENTLEIRVERFKRALKFLEDINMRVILTNENLTRNIPLGFEIEPISNIKERFYDYIKKKEKNLMKNDIIDKDVNTLLETIEKLDKRILFMNESLEKEKGKTGQFRNSIVYPIYRITNSLGKTRIGRFIEKILK